MRLGPRVRARLVLWQQAAPSYRLRPPLARAKRLGMMGAASVQWESERHLPPICSRRPRSDGELVWRARWCSSRPRGSGVSVALGSDACACPRSASSLGSRRRCADLLRWFPRPAFPPTWARWEARWGPSTRAYLDVFVSRASPRSSSPTAGRASAVRPRLTTSAPRARGGGNGNGDSARAARRAFADAALDPRDHGRATPSASLSRSPYGRRPASRSSRGARAAGARSRSRIAGVKLSYRSSEYRPGGPGHGRADPRRLNARLVLAIVITAMARLANLSTQRGVPLTTRCRRAAFMAASQLVVARQRSFSSPLDRPKEHVVAVLAMSLKGSSRYRQCAENSASFAVPRARSRSC